MLTLTRSVGETIRIGDDIEVHVVEVRGGTVRLGFKAPREVTIHREEVYGGDQVRESLLRVGAGPNLVQLLEPLTPDSPVQKLIDNNGGRGGLAHVAFRVQNAQTAFQYMKEAGFQLIDPAPRKGSRGTLVFFVHPKSLGVLIEIVEDPAA